MSIQNIVAMVPARAGSEGLRHKNIKPLHGIPLLGYSVKPALACRAVSAVYVNSDSPEYLEIAEEMGARPYRRPDSLGQATTSMQQVLADFVEGLRADSVPVDAVLALYPSHPFRTPQHLEEMIAYYQGLQDCDSLIGLKQPDLHPYLCMTLKADKSFKTFIDYDVDRFYRRQDYPVCYQYTAWTMLVNADRIGALNAQMMSERTVGYVVPEDVKIVDIDTEMDFLFAEYLLTHGYVPALPETEGNRNAV